MLHKYSLNIYQRNHIFSFFFNVILDYTKMQPNKIYKQNNENHKGYNRKIYISRDKLYSVLNNVSRSFKGDILLTMKLFEISSVYNEKSFITPYVYSPVLNSTYNGDN